MSNETLLKQMYCCLSCSGPFIPKKDALRKNSVAARAFYYMEGQAIKSRDEWNCSEDPVLLSDVDASHVFHNADIIPVMRMFFDGNMRNIWADDNTNGSDNRPDPHITRIVKIM